MAHLLHIFGDDLCVLLLTFWLDVQSLARLDVAMSCRTWRPHWETFLRSLRSAAIDDMHHSASSLMWLIQRRIVVTRIQMKVNAWRVPGCDLSLLDTSNLLHLGLDGCRSVTDECILKSMNRWGKENKNDLNSSIKYAVISAICRGCSKLRSINLGGCNEVTDAGISALGHGCGQLRTVNLRGCNQVTDAGILALAAGCDELQSINLESCDEVTDAGILALVAGCGQLRIINLE